MVKKHPILFILLMLLAVLILATLITGIVILGFAGGGSGEFQYLVVLGTTVNGTEPSSMLKDRIDAAYAYLVAHEDVICIVSGGKGDAENLSEAQCMFDRLTAMGISADRLWLEDKSTSTWENLQFSMNIIEGKTGTRPNKAGILSSEYHLYRAGLFASDCGFEAVGIPATTQRFTIRLNYFLREVAGVWHYLILGGLYND